MYSRIMEYKVDTTMGQDGLSGESFSPAVYSWSDTFFTGSIWFLIIVNVWTFYYKRQVCKLTVF